MIEALSPEAVPDICTTASSACNKCKCFLALLPGAQVTACTCSTRSNAPSTACSQTMTGRHKSRGLFRVTEQSVSA